MFELYQLRYFLAVVETGSFTKAASRACVTQPSLSAGIAKLEEQLELKLFHRSNRRVFLTTAGARFVDRAQAILFECNKAVLELRQTDEPQVLRLGVLKTVPGAQIGRLIRDFRRQEPSVVTELFDGTEQEILNRLDEGSIDIAITILRDTARDREAKALFREGYALALSTDHPLAAREVIEAEELSDEPMIVRTRCEVLSETSRHFTDRNVRPRLVYRTDQDERALEMVASGLGITVMPNSYQLDTVARVAMAGFNLERNIGLLRSPHGVSAENQQMVTTFEAFTASQDWAEAA